ncbi:MAG TPA: CDP-diacylglycerol--glycerol-3-phosphate 3-phosphatidyltransferase [Smithellaceae bacterium]|jgi:CDP-diacylglycerol--glycerol-3-phosphate 3-phosphatidyltransferase|nr:CDP-diacylglycerol--glycerol-3-phosphate 3-phosphatidyltransferase [Smithellaceae bacterium]
MIAKQVIFNLPNTITLIRLSVVPFLFILLWSPGEFWSLVLAILFVAASITDLLDGYIARKYQLVTTMGKFLDPIADKLMINTAMILMIPIGRIPAWIVALTIIRDFVVDGVRSIASSEGLFIQASRLGKQKTLAQIIAVTALLIHYPIFGADAHRVGIIVLYVAFVLTVYSGTNYFIQFYKRAGNN